MSTTIGPPALNYSLAAAAAAAMVTLTAPAFAAPSGSAPGPIRLMDGTTLVVAQDGWMRMFTAEGKRLYMEDGVPMETRDGKVIAMKEDLNWKQLRQFGTLSPRSR